MAPEIIVVDQNAPGYLPEVLAELPAVTHLMLTVPNASDARNRGFLASTGKIVLFIDDDLVPEEDFCLRALRIFQSYPVIQCWSPLVYSEEGKEKALEQALAKRIRVLDGDPGIFSITDTISAAVFFRREYFSRTGGFDPMLFEFAKTAEDQEFFLRMQKKGLELYFVPSVQIYHDEKIPGGCELRTQDYWVTRERCMKSWAYRHRIQHHPPGPLSAKDLYGLARSGFLNREVIASGFREIRRQMRLLFRSIKASDAFLKERIDSYRPVEQMDHLL